MVENATQRRLTAILSADVKGYSKLMVALQIKLTAGEAARITAETVNIKAYEKFLKATENYLYRTRESSLVARQLYEEAIALDPEYAMAYVMLGWTYLDDIWLGMTDTPAKSIAKAEAMAQKAISIHGVTTDESALLTGVHVQHFFLNYNGKEKKGARSDPFCIFQGKLSVDVIH